MGGWSDGLVIEVYGEMAEDSKADECGGREGIEFFWKNQQY